MKNVEETWQLSLVYQQKEKLIWNTESRLSRICHMTEWDHSELTENKNSHELTEIHKAEESTDFFRSDELLSTIHYAALSHSRISDIFYV